MPTQLPSQAAPAYEPTRTGRSAEALQRAVLDNLAFVQATPPAYATKHDWYLALATACATGCWRAGSVRWRPMRAAT